HVFLYMFMMPAFALLCSQSLSSLLNGECDSKIKSRWFLVFSLICIAFYPYGIFKSNVVHDALNSVIFAVTGLMFLFWAPLTPKKIGVLVVLTALANFSQVANYRNEPDTEYPFCEAAKKSFAETGKPVVTAERWTMTKEMVYCQG